MGEGSRSEGSKLGIRTRAARTPERIREDVLGILQLLVSAKDAVKAYGSDQLCANFLEQSLSRLMCQYGVDRPEPSKASAGDLADVQALLRLLIYAKAEVIGRLDDPTCAEMLDACVGHLLCTHQLSQEQLYQRALPLH